MANVKDQVKNLFKLNSAYKTLYAFGDGNIFSDINFAKNHQRTCKKDFETYHREDFSYSEPDPKKSKAKAGSNKPAKEGGSNKPPKATIQDQLKEIDLDKCDSKDYKAIKQLHDGLGLKSENNKFAAVLESLRKAKLELVKPAE